MAYPSYKYHVKTVYLPTDDPKVVTVGGYELVLTEWNLDRHGEKYSWDHHTDFGYFPTEAIAQAKADELNQGVKGA